MLDGVLSGGPPFDIFGAGQLQVKNEFGVLMLWNFTRLDDVPFEENTLPWLLTRGLTARGGEQRNQVLIPHDRDSSGRVQVCFRTGLALQGISPQELHIGPSGVLPY